MRRLRSKPKLVTAVALILAAGAVLGIAAAYGWRAFIHAWTNVNPAWVVLLIAAELLSLAAYTASYEALTSFRDGPELPHPLVLRIVVAGFGPLAALGGFALDKRALNTLEGDEDAARSRVLTLGALEWALLAPAAWTAAIALLATADRRPLPSLLWPWALAVPAGFGLGLWLARPARRKRIATGSARWRAPAGEALEAVGALPELVHGVRSCWKVWAGMAGYWALDIAAFYAALRFVGLSLNVAEALLAYATGYALTRRSMPLGGAGVTEALMTFALHWVGQPVPGALAAVVVYRVANLALPAVLAIAAHRRLQPLLRAADKGEVAPRAARAQAAAPVAPHR